MSDLKIDIRFRCGHWVTVPVQEEYNPADPFYLIRETALRGGKIMSPNRCDDCCSKGDV